MLCLQIDKESAELKACSLLYARMGDEESDTFFDRARLPHGDRLLPGKAHRPVTVP